MLHFQCHVGGWKSATVGVRKPWKVANTKNMGFPLDPQLLNIYYHTTVPFIKKSSKNEVPARQALLPNQRRQAYMHFKKQ